MSHKRLRKLVAAQTAGIEDLRLIKLLFLHRNQVLLAWSMTRLTTNARTQAIEIQLAAVNCAGRVTTETLLCLLACDRASQRIFSDDGTVCRCPIVKSSLPIF